MCCRYSRALSKFVVSKSVLQHTNHPTSADIYRMYPAQRRPKGRVAEEADSMLQVCLHLYIISRTVQVLCFATALRTTCYVVYVDALCS